MNSLVSKLSHRKKIDPLVLDINDTSRVLFEIARFNRFVGLDNICREILSGTIALVFHLFY